MTRALSDLKDEVLALSHKDRALLANLLVTSLQETESEEKVAALWRREAERRFQEYKKGNIDWLPLDEAFERAYRDL
ncbi:MAG: addiction module protein [Acidobacteriota bacterium]|nr:addiction module protein [Acidobacteriota bacterium]